MPDFVVEHSAVDVVTAKEEGIGILSHDSVHQSLSLKSSALGLGLAWGHQKRQP
jgi:hypothetical protein